MPESHVHGVHPWLTVLLIVALVIVVCGLLVMSEATSGIGLIAAGCFLGICARVLQAGAHHKAIMRRDVP